MSKKLELELDNRPNLKETRQSAQQELSLTSKKADLASLQKSQRSLAPSLISECLKNNPELNIERLSVYVDRLLSNEKLGSERHTMLTRVRNRLGTLTESMALGAKPDHYLALVALIDSVYPSARIIPNILDAKTELRMVLGTTKYLQSCLKQLNPKLKAAKVLREQINMLVAIAQQYRRSPKLDLDGKREKQLAKKLLNLIKSVTLKLELEFEKKPKVVTQHRQQ